MGRSLSGGFAVLGIANVRKSPKELRTFAFPVRVNFYNAILLKYFKRSHSAVVSIQDSQSCNPGSMPSEAIWLRTVIELNGNGYE